VSVLSSVMCGRRVSCVSEGPRGRPEKGERGVNGSRINFFHKKLTYVPRSKPQAKTSEGK
jgi:hypothetical protein